jgi:hypothetical protein
VSIKFPGEASRYWSWGHPTENNCKFEDAKECLLNAIDGKEWLGHNSQFECAVLRKYFGYVPKPLEVHDTTFMLFLTDPYAATFSLKPSAERILGIPPEEQDAVRDWILAHVPGATTSKDSPMFWAAFICKAPGKLVGRYAEGDTERTVGLATHLWPIIESRELVGAYEREQRLAPILSESSCRGVRLDGERLASDMAKIFLPAQKRAQDYMAAGWGV